jgi:8-oxo-dGTP diphosphatase
MTDCLHVAVAIITNQKQQVLITKRALRSPQGGLWEFPGGKLEPGEDALTALFREIKEEVALEVVQCRYLDNIVHTYPARTVSLWVYHVSHYTGNAHCREEQQDLQWVATNDLHKYPLLAASESVIALMKQEKVGLI